MRRFTMPLRALPMLIMVGQSGCVVPYGARSGEIVADTTASRQELLRAAQADQAAFEEWHRRHLPIQLQATPTRPRCQQPVDRFCLEEGTGYGAWLDLPGNPRIAEERAKLIAALREVATYVPDDDWIVGQRVRYTVEAGQMAEALAAAQDCAGTYWWCAALLGYVVYKGVDAAAAEPAFDLALGAMPPEERDRWLDPRPLLEPDDTLLYGQLNEASKAAFVDRFWRLADPFMTRPGNEIRAEHLARRVELQSQWGAATVDGVEWGTDLEDILLRYGSPSERIAAVGAEYTLFEYSYHIGPSRWVPDLMSHYTMAAVDLLPPAEAVLTGRGTWDSIEQVPHAGYDVPVGDSAAIWLAPLAHQVAVFPRGDETAVVAAFDLPSHGFLGVEGGEGALAILPAEDPLTEAEVAPARVADGVGVTLERTASRPALMSLEAFIPGRHVAGRVRRWLDTRPPGPEERAMSDILLLRSSRSAPQTLEEAVEVAQGSNRVSSGDEVSIYWEMYGLDRLSDSTVTMSLRVVPEESTGLRRLGEIVGVGGVESLAEVRWQEEVTGEATMPRSVALVIPALRDGTHALVLTMNAGPDTVTSSAEIVVAGRPVEPLAPSSMTRRPQLGRLLCVWVGDHRPVVGNLGNRAASAPYQDLLEQFFNNDTLEPPPCPTRLHDILYETGHGY